MKRFWPSLLLLIGLPATVAAQQADTLQGALPEVRVEATRAVTSVEDAPFALAVRTRGPEELSLSPGLSLDDVLGDLPGLWLNDRGHAALGERLSVRGMGWQAAFGVRGVQVVLDGLPLTMPDGQSVLDAVEPALVRRAELVRGPASLFWGNAGGGVLYLSTALPPTQAATRLRVLGGSNALRQVVAEVATPVGDHFVQVYASDIRRAGFRQHSEDHFTRAGLHGGVALRPDAHLQLTATLARLDAQSPGALTLEEMLVDARQADPRNVTTSAGKQSLQAQTGATLLVDTPLGLVTATAHGLVRDLENPLPFAYIQLDRRAGGARVQLQREAAALAWGVGIDAGAQRDDRINRNNEGGRPGSDLQLDQREHVRNAAAFAHLGADLGTRLHLSAGVRADWIRFRMEDRLPANGDQSGARAFSAFSPAAGLAYRLRGGVLFAGYATAFETPTTTEFVNGAHLTGGFNPELGPQRTHGLEVGARGPWPSARFHVDAALYRLYVRGRLLPFQNDDGRTFYRNAGRSTHDGVELSARYDATRAVQLRLTYNGGRYVFEDDALAGRRLPGIPAHRLHASVELLHAGLRGRVAAEAASAAYVDDTNTTQSDGYLLVDVEAGHAELHLGRVHLRPFVRVNNLLDASYAASLIVNARGGRFFEPAPGRTLQAGLTLAL